MDYGQPRQNDAVASSSNLGDGRGVRYQLNPNERDEIPILEPTVPMEHEKWHQNPNPKRVGNGLKGYVEEDLQAEDSRRLALERVRHFKQQERNFKMPGRQAVRLSREQRFYNHTGSSPNHQP